MPSSYIIRCALEEDSDGGTCHSEFLLTSQECHVEHVTPDKPRLRECHRVQIDDPAYFLPLVTTLDGIDWRSVAAAAQNGQTRYWEWTGTPPLEEWRIEVMCDFGTIEGYFHNPSKMGIDCPDIVWSSHCDSLLEVVLKLSYLPYSPLCLLDYESNSRLRLFPGHYSERCRMPVRPGFSEEIIADYSNPGGEGATVVCVYGLAFRWKQLTQLANDARNAGRILIVLCPEAVLRDQPPAWLELFRREWNTAVKFVPVVED